MKYIHVIGRERVKIKMMLLRNNGVNKFDEKLFKSARALKIALIEGNPLFCDCGPRWMKEVMEDIETYPWAEGWRGSAGPTCDSPKPMKKMLVSSIATEDLTCDPPVVTALSPEDTRAVAGKNVTLTVRGSEYELMQLVFKYV